MNTNTIPHRIIKNTVIINLTSHVVNLFLNGKQHNINQSEIVIRNNYIVKPYPENPLFSFNHLDAIEAIDRKSKRVLPLDELKAKIQAVLSLYADKKYEYCVVISDETQKLIHNYRIKEAFKGCILCSPNTQDKVTDDQKGGKTKGVYSLKTYHYYL